MLVPKCVPICVSDDAGGVVRGGGFCPDVWAAADDHQRAYRSRTRRSRGRDSFQRRPGDSRSPADRFASAAGHRSSQLASGTDAKTNCHSEREYSGDPCRSISAATSSHANRPRSIRALWLHVGRCGPSTDGASEAARRCECGQEIVGAATADGSGPVARGNSRCGACDGWFGRHSAGRKPHGFRVDGDGWLGNDGSPRGCAEEKCASVRAPQFQ